MMALDITEHENAYLHVPDGLYLLTSLDCPGQTRHSYLPVHEGQSRRFSVLVSGSEGIFLLVRPALRTYVHYQRPENKNLAELLCSEEVSIPANSIFV